MTWLKIIVVGGVVTALGLFVVQNREVLELRFLTWHFETRRAYVVLGVFLGGFVSGWVVATVGQLTVRNRQLADPRPERGRASRTHRD